ncbi:unnamed protein product, partial [Symbiodinium natans]
MPQDQRDTDAPKWHSAERDGPRESAGSAGHPSMCKPCAFYCFTLIGCRAD